MDDLIGACQKKNPGTLVGQITLPSRDSGGWSYAGEGFRGLPDSMPRFRERLDRILASQSDAAIEWQTEVLAAERRGVKVEGNTSEVWGRGALRCGAA